MTETEIKNEIIALDKEKLTYIKLKRSDLEMYKCKLAILVYKCVTKI